MNYKITYCLREKTANRGYRLFALQTVILKTSTKGSLLKVLRSHADITHITDVNNHKLSFIGLDGEPSYLEIDVFKDQVLDSYEPFSLHKSNMYPFTQREQEILQLLAKGLSTKDIANQLILSITTIETHRKNIMAKTKAKNTTELIVDCIQMGYL